MPEATDLLPPKGDPKPTEGATEKPPEQPKVLTADTIGGLKIQKVFELTNLVNVLIYGDSGIGKTVLAGSASIVAEMGPVVVVDFEGGTISLKDFYPDVDVVRVKTIREMQRVYDELYRMKHNYKTVVIDSLTEVQKMFMSEIVKAQYQKDPDKYDEDVPGIYEWGKNTEQIRKLVRAYRDLPMNSIFTALAMETKDKNNVTRTVPNFSNKLIGEVPGLVDIVLYMYTKKIDKNTYKRLLLTRKTDTTVAKDRTNKLPVVVEEPTFQMLYDLIYNGEQG